MPLLRRYLLNREVQAVDTAIRTVVLPRAGLLSAIGLRIEMTNGATRGAALVQDQINRVEVIANGSEVLFSLEGNELYRWNYVWLRKRPPQRRDETNGVVQELFLFVPFGRCDGPKDMPVGDEELYLDLSKYQSVELRINYTTTIGATAFVTGTTTFSEILYYWDAVQAPGASRGYCRTTQFRAFTSLGAGEDSTELPRRNKLMDILVWARAAAVAPDSNITIAEVRENNALITPYTGRWADIAEENIAWLDLDTIEHGRAFAQDVDTVDMLCYRPYGTVLTPTFVQSDANGLVTVCVNLQAGDRLTISASELADAAATTHFTTYAARRAIDWSTRGVGIPGAIYIPLWDGQDLRSAYDAPSKNRVDFALTQGAAGAVVRASLRELVGA
jgi:phage tail protein X